MTDGHPEPVCPLPPSTCTLSLSLALLLLLLAGKEYKVAGILNFKFSSSSSIGSHTHTHAHSCTLAWSSNVHAAFRLVRRIRPVVAFHSNPLALSESFPPPRPLPHRRRRRCRRSRCCCWSAAPFCAKMFNFFATVKIFGWLTQPISNESSRHAAWAGVLALWVVAVVQWLVGICTSYGYMCACVCGYT